MIKIQPTGPKALTLADVPEGRVAFVDRNGEVQMATRGPSFGKRWVIGEGEWLTSTPIRAILTEPAPPKPLTIGDLTEPCLVETEDGAVLAVQTVQHGGSHANMVVLRASPAFSLTQDIVSSAWPIRPYTVTREG